MKSDVPKFIGRMMSVKKIFFNQILNDFYYYFAFLGNEILICMCVYMYVQEIFNLLEDWLLFWLKLVYWIRRFIDSECCGSYSKLIWYGWITSTEWMSNCSINNLLQTGIFLFYKKFKIFIKKNKLNLHYM